MATWHGALREFLVSLPWGELKRFVLLALISAGVTLGLPILLHESGLFREVIAVGLAFLVAFFVNFIMARRFVFRTQAEVGPQLVRFALANLSFRAAEYLAFLAIFSLLDVYYVLATAIVLLTSFVIKFVFYRVFVFSAAEVRQ